MSYEPTTWRIAVRDGFVLSPIRETDKQALFEHLQAKEISETTLTIPYPYAEADAESWIQKRLDHTKRVGKHVSLVIRDFDSKLIGAVGADSLEPGTTHRGEIGYWLAKPYWGKGIMTDAVRAFVAYAFAELEVERLIAHVFDFNLSSARVLEKNGFKLEGYLRKHYRKAGKLFDARLYGLLKEELR